MAHHLTAQTNKGSYRPAYYHLNEHQDLGWGAKVVAGKFRPNEGGDSGERWLYITTSRPVTEPELIRGVLWQLWKQCTCEHDCCGCVQTVVGGRNAQRNRTSSTKATRWAVPAYSYRNL